MSEASFQLPESYKGIGQHMPQYSVTLVITSTQS